ncbi:MAG TPA: hypothetical protein VGL15_02365 [Vicinamibacteria bacterium]|jgi:hypothetical protein
MRNLGGVLLLAGIIGFFYCSSELSKYSSPPPETSIGQMMDHPAGRMELGRYVAAGAAFLGVLLVMFPKGR